MEKQNILIVEDDKNIGRLVCKSLENAGFNCLHDPTGADVEKILTDQAVDLVLLDINLPKASGFDLCRMIRQKFSRVNIPIIMLTSQVAEVDRVLGFELGADDYVAKPFSCRELVLRVKAVLKRSQQQAGEKEMMEAGDIKIDIPRHKVTCKGREVELTPMEFDLLKTLMQRRGRVQSRETLLSDVWDIKEGVLTRTVDTHIKRLREKLGPAGELIETVPGLGYRFREE